jgi:hypothetical protein
MSKPCSNSLPTTSRRTVRKEGLHLDALSKGWALGSESGISSFRHATPPMLLPSAVRSNRRGRHLRKRVLRGFKPCLSESPPPILFLKANTHKSRWPLSRCPCWKMTLTRISYWLPYTASLTLDLFSRCLVFGNSHALLEYTCNELLPCSATARATSRHR